MTTASLELCKELYEVSGWDDPELNHNYNAHDTSKSFYCPLYDLGYLLRKLPASIDVEDEKYQMMLINAVETPTDECWGAMYTNQVRVDYPVYAPSPEDAAAMLAIELIKQGVIKI